MENPQVSNTVVLTQFISKYPLWLADLISLPFLKREDISR